MLSHDTNHVKVQRTAIVRYAINMAKTKQTSALSPEEVSRLGEQFYFDQLKEKLEKEHSGEYVVIDAARKEYILQRDKLKAIEEARKKFGDKLFLIIQIGAIQSPAAHFQDLYAWKL